MNKRKMATFKNKMTTIIKLDTPANHLMQKADHDDNALIKKVLKGSKRPPGYRAYTSTPEFRTKMAIDIAKESEAVRKAQGNPKLNFSTQELFRMRESYKHKAWKALPAAERMKWEASISDDVQGGSDSMTQWVSRHESNPAYLHKSRDERTLAFHRHVVGHLHDVSRHANMYMVLYATMSYEGKQWATL